MIVFARQPDEPLGRLLIQLDQWLRQDKSATRRIWVTFLSHRQPQLDAQLVDWGKRLGLARLPVSIFEDDHGPPAYRIPDEAAVVVVFANKRRIVASRLFSRKEWEQVKLDSLLDEIRRFLEANGEAGLRPGQK